MIKSSQRSHALQIEKILDSYFPDPQIPLFHTSPFTLLIAVLLSAQCSDERVNSVTQELFSLAPTAEKMLMLPLKKIEEIIHPLGFFRLKAAYIHKTCQILVEKHNGEVPSTFTELEGLPGVGHKTASVVMVQAFNIPAFPVDRHIFRSAKRWHLSNGSSVEAVEKDLKALFPKKNWGKVHLQIIFFSRAFCTAVGHKVSDCPICSSL